MRSFAALLIALLPASVLAATERGGKGMPQFQFGNVLTLTQIVWMAVIFFILYLILWLWVLPSLKTVLDERQQRISTDLDRAKAAKLEADRAVAELMAATRTARAEAQSEIAAATQAARAAASARAAALNERLEGELKEAEARIAAARGAAMGALRDVASDTAAAMIARLTGRPPEAAALAQAIEVSLAARPNE